MNNTLLSMQLSYFIRLFIALSVLVIVFLLFIDFNILGHNFHVGISFFSLCVIYIIISLPLFFILKEKQRNKDYLNYAILLQMLALIYSISGPLLVFVWGVDPKIGFYLYTNFNEIYFSKVLLLFVLFQIGIAIGSLIPVISFNIREVLFSVKHAVPLCWIMLIASYLPYLFLFFNADNSIDSNDKYLAGFHALGSSGRVYLYLGFFKLLPLTFLLIYYIYNKIHRGVFLIIIMIILITLIMPSRGYLFSTILTAILAYNYFNRYFSFKQLAIALLFLLVISVIIVAFRSNFPIQSNMVIHASEGRAMFENTYLIYDYLQTSGSFRLGEDYLTAPLRLIPQWVFPIEKTEPLSSWLLDTFYPALKEKGGGRMFSLVGESYLNFKMLGPLFFGILLSISIKTLYIRAMRMKHKIGRKAIPLSPIIYIFLCSQLYYLLRGDSIAFLVRLTPYTILPLFILLCFARLVPKNVS